MKIRSFLLAVLLTLHPLSKAHAEKYGIEIELQGRAHKLVHFCTGVTIGSMRFETGALIIAPFYLSSDETRAQLVKTVPALFSIWGICLASTAFGSNAVGSNYLQRLEKVLRPRAEKGELTLYSDNKLIAVDYPTGEHVLFTLDQGTIEVKMPAQSSKDIQKRIEFFDREVFDVAKRAGLHAPRIDGPWNGGHIHVDLESAFKKDPNLLKKFLLDYWSHPELAQGLMVIDPLNAKPLRTKKERDLAFQLLRRLDEPSASKHLLDPFFLLELKRQYHPILGKSSALNINPILGTLEVRALRSQKSGTELFKVVNLIENRIAYSQSLSDEELMSKFMASQSKKTGTKGELFRKYVEETGLPYWDYRELVPKRFQENANQCLKLFSRINKP